MSRPEPLPLLLPPLLDQAQALAAEALRPGDLAVDATVGRGRDTAWLARQVGPSGLVLGFDPQPAALDSARSLLLREGLLDRVLLFQAGHENFPDHLHHARARPLGAAMFNLGYLPGGDHSLTTSTATTLPALHAIFEALRPGGRITAVSYPGHPGGADELAAVESWARSLDRPPGSTAPPHARALRLEFLYSAGPGPVLLVVDRALQADE
jgi:predicted methyltransferase